MVDSCTVAMVFEAAMVAKSTSCWLPTACGCACDTTSDFFLFCANYGRYGATNEP